MDVFLFFSFVAVAVSTGLGGGEFLSGGKFAKIALLRSLRAVNSMEPFT